MRIGNIKSQNTLTLAHSNLKHTIIFMLPFFSMATLSKGIGKKYADKNLPNTALETKYTTKQGGTYTCSAIGLKFQ